jgi:bifunctional polynucleotide phosphatase/kinase
MPYIYTLNNPTFRPKMASFDYDWTMVCPQDGKIKPTSVDDWKWMFPNVKSKIKEYYDNGFMIVIFTNQSKMWKHEQIKNVANSIGIPLFIVIPSNKTEYKPNIILFNSLIELLDNNIINKDESFFVGDALGRTGDFAKFDKEFAENINIRCYSPEQMFHEKKDEIILIPDITLPEEKCIIIMMGFPGSGKTTIAKHICKNDKYIYIEGDKYKTIPARINASKKHINNNKSIVFDATHSSKKHRTKYVELAKEYEYNVVCIHVTTSLEESFRRNKLRDYEKNVPRIAYSVYSKYYETPDVSEGFCLITV